MQNLTIIFRSIWTGKFYSFISILGLAVAFASVVLVATLIRQETSFEETFKNADNIYRLTWENRETGDKFATMFNPSSPQMVIDFPEVIDAARVGPSKLMVEVTQASGEPLKNFEDMAFVDPSFFNVFNFDFQEGDPETALSEPQSIVLTKAAAEKYFGDESALGKTMLLENEVALTVRGIITDMPENTHFAFHFMINLETMLTLFGGAGFLDNWGSDRVYHYVLVEDGVSRQEILDKMPDFAARHLPFDSNLVTIGLQPLKDIHFTNNLQDDVPFQDTIKNITKAPRKKADLVLFGAGALVLVLVASFNFMNLQIARSVGKNRQMGLFKVFGATRKKITRFILLETLVLSFLALGLSAILIELLLPGFGALLGSELSWSSILSPEILLLTLGVTFLVALISGLYPALLIGSQAPSRILKGEFSLGTGAERARQTLVFLQFAVSIVLIIVSFGIYSQINYSLSIPLGFDSEGVILADVGRSESRQAYGTLRTRLLEHPDIAYVSRASIVPPGSLSDGFSIVPEGGDPNNEVGVRLVMVDYDYFEALGIDMVAGRTYTEEFPSDVTTFPRPENPNTMGAIILNETAAKAAGWSDMATAITKTTSTRYSIGDTPVSVTSDVVGIAPDIHFKSLRSEVSPIVFILFPNGANKMIIRTEGTGTGSAMAYLETVWADLIPGLPITATWLTSSVDQLYAQERKTLNLLSSISLLAILVAALGLFAVATLVIEKRTKEVGLRKVLGAKARQIVNLLSWQFMKPVLLANLIAWPVAWIYLADWLEVFVYRFDITPMHFLIPAIIAILVAWGTVAAQAWKVARANPIKALRYE